MWFSSAHWRKYVQITNNILWHLFIYLHYNPYSTLFIIIICGFLQVEKESRDDDDTPDPPKPLLCTLCPQICSSPTALGEHVLQAHRSLSSPLCESPRPPSRKSCSKCTEELASPNAVCPHRKVSMYMKLINSILHFWYICTFYTYS